MENKSELLEALISAIETIEWMNGCSSPDKDEVEEDGYRELQSRQHHYIHKSTPLAWGRHTTAAIHSRHHEGPLLTGAVCRAKPETDAALRLPS